MNALARVSLALAVLLGAYGEAASQPSSALPLGAPRALDGPRVPVSPEIISRSEDGTRGTVRAVRLTQPIIVDGRLEEAAYAAVHAVSGFVQNIPDRGQPASQRTDAWVFFDTKAIYLSARCWDTRPEAEWTANERRRDQLGQQDNFAVLLDTYFDRRNGFIFYTNPLGAQADVYVTNESNANTDFNPVWDVRTDRFNGGWTVEMRIPFTSLRYKPGTAQVWGIQFRRMIRARNEWTYITQLPAGLGPLGLMRVSLTPTLVGLEVPSGSKNLEVKPFAVATLASDRVAAPPVSRHPSGDVGVDVKYGVTQNLTADFTYNTDVAAAEADDQQVNLTRFNLSLPEKRDFFLEGRGIFNFGAGGPSLFYSRQIGLSGGRVVPIVAGGRLTGKTGRATIGVIDIATGTEAAARAEPTNFTVARVRYDVMRRSTVGAILTNRSRSLAVPGRASPAYGVDGSFGFFENLTFDGSYARTHTPGATARATYAEAIDFNPDAWGFSATHLFVDKGFNPEVGFVNRDNIRQTVAAGRFSPRPARVAHVERFSLTATTTYTRNTTGLLESHNETTGFSTEFENGDVVSVGASHDLDRLLTPFRIAPGVTIPVGGYAFNTTRASYAPAPNRRVSGTVAFDYGGFYGGKDATVSYSGRVTLTQAFALQPSVNVHWIRLPNGRFTSQLWRTRVVYTFTPQMFLSGLVQYNTATHTVGVNMRLRWEYRKGSELFVVYNENQNAQPARGGFAELLDRSVAVKVTRLLRF